MAEPGELVAALCRELEQGDLQSIADQAGAAEILTRIIGALRNGTEPPALAAEWDELQEALIRYGIDGGLVPPAKLLYRSSPAAAGDGHPVIEVWACPGGRCSRWHVAADTADPPTCAVNEGAALVRRRIST